ncbi:penicillin-binding protein 2 [Silvibacterium acidisoli]|uniref:penicillin-binding protein 2 n=1 Tax=Acidobacteriaceae bacterium ZG23-2 TaxID=2883246 RepID=UPI00406C033B
MDLEVVQKEEKLPAIKLTIFQYVIVGVMLVLIFGLWRLQVVGAENYRALAEANRIRKVPILAPRGQIFDREGRLLVDNYPSVSCFLVREQGHDFEPDLPLIARGLHMTVDQIHAILRKYRAAPKYQPLPLKQDITPDEQEFIEAHRDEMPELETVDEQRRLYPKDGFAAHLIGYVGEVSEEMLNDPRYAYYEPGDVVGKSGVEASYDAILRGTDGSRDVLVDSHGREVGKLGTERSKPGQSLRLTIDLDIQRAAENALGDRQGAIVALDPHTGEVLAMVSRPTFDPNAFAVKIGRDEWNKLITDPNHPLLNKAIQAQSPPGSTFKIIMSVAGLQEGVAQNLKVNCQGGAELYGHFYACDRHHGAVDIHNAIPLSCDTYYYNLAARLGIDTIAKYAHGLGIGMKTGIDLPDEITGVMPSTEWKMKTFHEKWYAGEAVSVGIGQGAVAATPIQLARALGGIASGGVLKRPHVVFPDELPAEFRTAMRDSFPGSGDKTMQIDPANWETITDGMAAVTGPGGTAFADHLENIDFAGKTGTAQVVNHSFGALKVSSNVNERANAWFVGMAPRRNPDIVVAVFWQHGGWGNVSAPLAAKVIEAFVDKQRRLNHNLVAEAAEKPVEVGAVWADPAKKDAAGAEDATDAVGTVHTGHFALKPSGNAAAGDQPVQHPKPAVPKPAPVTPAKPEEQQ